MVNPRLQKIRSQDGCLIVYSSQRVLLLNDMNSARKCMWDLGAVADDKWMFAKLIYLEKTFCGSRWRLNR